LESVVLNSVLQKKENGMLVPSAEVAGAIQPEERAGDDQYASYETRIIVTELRVLVVVSDTVGLLSLG
jgi:hypothetical protein